MPNTNGYQQQIEKAVTRSRQTPEDATQSLAPGADGFGILWFASQFANAIVPWGNAPTVRDAQLKAFLTTEPVAASAFATVVGQYAAFAWKLEGPEQSKNAAHDLLHQAQWGKGWADFISLLAWDYLSQDKGAFIEIIRASDSPSAPCVGIKHLDASACWPTGDPEEPVIYFDRKGGKYHKLKWYQVWQLSELPMSHPVHHGLQLSALSRVLQQAQTWFNIETYEEEKTGGRHAKAIHMVSGIPQAAVDAMQDALKGHQENADQRGLSRYIQPLIYSTLSPEAKASVATLELSAMPEGWDKEKAFKVYMTVLSMALLSDYQEFAPLPGGNLGSGSQSEVLDQKAAKKGPGLFRKRVEHMMNFAGILPRNVEFSYDEQDIDEEAKRAEIKKTRADTVVSLMGASIVDAAGARQILLDDGDISEELFNQLNARDLTENSIRDDERQKVMTELRRGTAMPGTPTTTPQPAGNAPAGDSEIVSKEVVAELVRGLGRKEQELGAFLQTRIHRAFTTAADDLAALGYMDTAGRIQLSSIIGDALKAFAAQVDAEIAEIAEQRLADEDIRLLMEKAERAGPTEERLEAEAAAAEKIEKGLGKAFARIKARLNA